MSSYIGFCNGKISEMPETLDSLLFHELTHWFHGMTGCTMTNKSRFIKALMGKFMSKNSIRNLIEVWTNEEEMRTISGFFLIGGKFEFDPLNTNMYEIFKAHKLGIPIEQIRQRIFHVDYYSIPKILWETLHSAENFTIKPTAKLLDAIH